MDRVETPALPVTKVLLVQREIQELMVILGQPEQPETRVQRVHQALVVPLESLVQVAIPVPQVTLVQLVKRDHLDRQEKPVALELQESQAPLETLDLQAQPVPLEIMASLELLETRVPLAQLEVRAQLETPVPRVILDQLEELEILAQVDQQAAMV